MNAGFFMEIYKKSEFKKNGIDIDFVQYNHSKSSYGVIHGLHFQKEPHAQSKLCINGNIFDIVVDIRKDSEHYGKYVSAEQSDENKHLLFIPQGFAHGFQILSKEAEIEYLVDNEYAPEYEKGIHWSDPQVNVDWPVEDIFISKKDLVFSTLHELE